jgi:hypothetical protein
MIEELVIGVGTAAAVGFTYARRRRLSLYRDLEGRLVRAVNAQAPDLAGLAQRELPSFDDRLVTLPDLLPVQTFATLRAEAERLATPERSFVPAHKKGGTVAYENLIMSAPAIVALYHSKDFSDFISRLIGVPVRPTPIYDQSSLSLLFYDKPGDHIGWHYDHNFYRGRHFTVLLMIANAGHAADGLSHGETRARIRGPEPQQENRQEARNEIAVRAAPNTLTVFEGAQVRHKATPVEAGEVRLVLSMTYCTDPRALWWQGASRRIKDTAYFGIRALWT